MYHHYHLVQIVCDSFGKKVYNKEGKLLYEFVCKQWVFFCWFHLQCKLIEPTAILPRRSCTMRQTVQHPISTSTYSAVTLEEARKTLQCPNSWGGVHTHGRVSIWGWSNVSLASAGHLQLLRMRNYSSCLGCCMQSCDPFTDYFG